MSRVGERGAGQGSTLHFLELNEHDPQRRQRWNQRCQRLKFVDRTGFKLRCHRPVIYRDASSPCEAREVQGFRPGRLGRPDRFRRGPARHLLPGDSNGQWAANHSWVRCNVQECEEARPRQSHASRPIQLLIEPIVAFGMQLNCGIAGMEKNVRVDQGSLEAFAFEMPKCFRSVVDMDKRLAHIKRPGTQRLAPARSVGRRCLKL